MARRITPLTDKEIQSAKKKEKKYKLSDRKGLFLEIRLNGSKLWHLSYCINGKSKEYAISTLKNYSLKEEREKLKKLFVGNIDINEVQITLHSDTPVVSNRTVRKEDIFIRAILA